MSDRAATIRRAGPDDAEAVHTLLCELADHERSRDSVTITPDGLSTLLRRPDVVVLVAEQGRTAVGYVSAVRTLNLWLGGDILSLDDLYVRPEARDVGLGAQLMHALADHVAAEDLIIRWEANLDNEAGHRFYRRLGATLRTKVIAAWLPADRTGTALAGRAAGRGRCR